MSDVSVGQVHSDQIPLVDVAPLVSGNHCPRTADALRTALQDGGFAYIRNHGISREVVSRARDSALAFFRLPEAAKAKVAVSPHHRGWLPTGGARMADNVPTDLKESFVWGDEGHSEPGTGDHSLRGPNQWPEEPPADLRGSAEQWFESAQNLAACLLRALARSLGVESDFFLRHSDRPLSRGSFVYYPQRLRGVPGAADRFGVGPHTDFGVMTLLCQDQVGGLQIENPRGEWIDAPPIADTLVVNVGDLLARWTNSALRSVPHRVISPIDRDRLSLVLAFDPNPETVVDARQLFPDAADIAEPITCGDYLDWRFSQAFAYRRDATPQAPP